MKNAVNSEPWVRSRARIAGALGTICLLASMTLLTGCLFLSVTGAFSPVQGPLSKQLPAPTYAAKLTGVLSGSITVTLGTGEVCKGSWAFVSPTTPDRGNSQVNALDFTALPASWDFVYGSGYYVAHVLGTRQYARAVLIGTMGTNLYVELSNENNTRGNTRGVSLDNRGNVFKVSVYN